MGKEDISFSAEKIGYVRGDTHAELTRQSEVLLKYINLDDIFSDLAYIHKNDWRYRNSIIDNISKGSTLFVDSIVHISNNLMELAELLNLLGQKDIRFVAINECIETATLYGRGMADILCGAIEILNIRREDKGVTLGVDTVGRIVKGAIQIEKKYPIKIEQKKINYYNQYNKVTGININEIRLGEAYHQLYL